MYYSILESFPTLQFSASKLLCVVCGCTVCVNTSCPILYIIEGAEVNGQCVCGSGGESVGLMASVQCGVCTVWSVYSVECVQCGVCTVWGVYSVGCGVWGVYSVGCVQCRVCTVWGVYTVYCLQCGVCTVWDVQSVERVCGCNLPLSASIKTTSV